MSGSEQPTRTALYVFAPVYVSSSIGLALVRLERSAHSAARFTLGDRAIRIPAGVYRMEPSAEAPVRVICDDDAIETVAIGADADWRTLRGRLREFLGDVSRSELAQFLATPSRALVEDTPPEADQAIVARLSVRHRPPEERARFHIESEATVRIAVFGPGQAEPIIGEGSVDAELPPGLYRVRYERCGAAVEEIVDHVDDTLLRHAGPPLVTPAPISGAATSQPYYIAAAERFSLRETCDPLGAPPYASRLFVLIRRAAAEAEPRWVPSEPVTIHDVTGRQLTALGSGNSFADDAHGYVAFTASVSPGTYRIRAGRPRRDVAVTIPAQRAAHVFIADRGALVLDDLRVSLVPADQPFDPTSPSHRAMEAALFALRTAESDTPGVIRDLALQDVDRDLCLGIVAAHLALRAGDRARFEDLVERLAAHSELPDVAVLNRIARGDDQALPLTIVAPPLFRDSLTLALADPRFEIAAKGAIAQAACAGVHASVWCTWGARWYDVLGARRTIEMMHDGDRRYDAATIAQCAQLPRGLVEAAIAQLDATQPRHPGAAPRIEQIEVPGYRLSLPRRGAHGIVFHAQPERGRVEVALKVVPLAVTDEALRRADELLRVHRIAHGQVIRFAAFGRLPGDTGLWFEMERCTKSLLDVVVERGEPLPHGEAVRYVLEALEGLAVLHAQGLVHGGIKPTNLLLRGDGSVALGDVGFTTRLIEPDAQLARDDASDSVRFAAPEQLRGDRQPQLASDVWSMTAVLYFLLTLELPRDRYTDQSELEAATRNPMVAIRERASELPESLSRCIDRALSVDVAQRPRDAAELAAELRHAQSRAAVTHAHAHTGRHVAAHRDELPVPTADLSLDSQPLLDELCHWLRAWFDRTYCRILAVDARSEQLAVVAAAAVPRDGGFAWAPWALPRTAVADLPRALHNGELLWLDHAALRELAPGSLPLDARRLHELLRVPIFSGGRLAGILELGECRAPRPEAASVPNAERRRRGFRDGTVAVSELARQAARFTARALEAERRRQLLEFFEERLEAFQPDASTLWSDIARFGADLLSTAVGAVYTCESQPDEFVLRGHVGNLNLCNLLVDRCRRGEGFVGTLAPDPRAWKRWPEINASASPFTGGDALTSALAIAVRGAGVDAVLLVADHGARSFTELDIEILERFVRHASRACRRIYLTPERRLAGEYNILRQINDVARKAQNLDQILHAILTGVTAGYGLRFNRAVLLECNDARGTLDARMAVGNLRYEAAVADWQHDRRWGPRDFEDYLRESRDAAMPVTPLHEIVADLSLPIDGAGDLLRDALSRPYLLVAGADLQRLPEALRAVLDPDVQTEILLVRLMTTRAVGLLIVDNRFTRDAIGPDAVDAAMAYASSAALAIESFPPHDEDQRVNEAARALTGQSGSDDAGSVMRQIVGQARLLFSAPLAVLWPYDRARMSFDAPVSSDADAGAKLDQPAVRTSLHRLARRVLDHQYVMVPGAQTDTVVLDRDLRAQLPRMALRSFQAIALQIGSDSLGALYIAHDEPREFTAADRRILTKFAARAALALKIARLSRSVQRPQENLSVAARREPLTDLEQTLDDVVSCAKAMLGCDVVALHVYNASTDSFERPQRHAGALRDEPATRLYPERVSRLAREVMELAEPIAIPDVSQHPDFGATRFARAEGIRSCLAFPLRARDRRVGALFVNYREPRRSMADLLAIGSGFARQAAAAIGNALRLRDNEVLARLNHELLKAESLQATLDAVARTAVKLLGGQPAVSYVVLKERGDLVIRAVAGDDRDALGASRPAGPGSHAGFAADASEPVISDYETETRFFKDHELARRFRSGMSVRIFVDDEVIGVLEIRSWRKNQFDDPMASLVSTLAAQAAIAIKSEQARAEMRRREAHLKALRAAEECIEQARYGQQNRQHLLSKLLQITVDCFRKSRDAVGAHDHGRDELDAHDERTFGVIFLVRDADTLAVESVYPAAMKPRFDEVIGAQRSLHERPIGITGRAVIEGRPILVANVPADPDHLEVIPSTRSEIAAPIILFGNAVGVLDVESDSRRAFDKDDLGTLVTLAGFVAIALTNHRLEHIQSAAQELDHSVTESRRRALNGVLLNDSRGLHALEIAGRLRQQLADFDDQVRLARNIMAAVTFMNERPLELEEISSKKLAQLITAVANAQRDVAVARSIQLVDLQHLGEREVSLWIDAAGIQQAVTNMIAFAISQATKDQQVEVRTTRVSDPDSIVVAVTAPGPARLTAEELRRISEPYAWMPPPSITPGPGEHGHRLGLSIAKRLVEAHGGLLWAEHNDQEGFTVKFALQVAAAAARRVTVDTRPARGAVPILTVRGSWLDDNYPTTSTPETARHDAGIDLTSGIPASTPPRVDAVRVDR